MMSRYRALPARPPRLAESNVTTWRGPVANDWNLLVVLAELIVEELISHTQQRLLGKDASEQQRPRVCCGKKNGVDGKQSMMARTTSV
jgi:hypothetical protein